MIQDILGASTLQTRGRRKVKMGGGIKKEVFPAYLAPFKQPVLLM